ncbi:hypothetical protein DFH06DRAFT_1149413 [Mycena polygramma]|nr:hypothetical protein DFH06DRAFT_1149413 [Mycena polygramma]
MSLGVCCLRLFFGHNCWQYNPDLQIIWPPGQVDWSVPSYIDGFLHAIIRAPTVLDPTVSRVLYCHTRGKSAHPFLLVYLKHAALDARPVILKLQGFDGPVTPNGHPGTKGFIDPAEGLALSVAGAWQTHGRDLADTRYKVRYIMTCKARITDLLVLAELATERDRTRTVYPATLFLALAQLFQGYTKVCTKIWRSKQPAPLRNDAIVAAQKDVVEAFRVRRQHMQELIDLKVPPGSHRARGFETKNPTCPIVLKRDVYLGNLPAKSMMAVKSTSAALQKNGIFGCLMSERKEPAKQRDSRDERECLNSPKSYSGSKSPQVIPQRIRAVKHRSAQRARKRKSEVLAREEMLYHTAHQHRRLGLATATYFARAPLAQLVPVAFDRPVCLVEKLRRGSHLLGNFGLGKSSCGRARLRAGVRPRLEPRGSVGGNLSRVQLTQDRISPNIQTYSVRFVVLALWVRRPTRAGPPDDGTDGPAMGMGDGGSEYEWMLGVVVVELGYGCALGKTGGPAISGELLADEGGENCCAEGLKYGAYLTGGMDVEAFELLSEPKELGSLEGDARRLQPWCMGRIVDLRWHLSLPVIGLNSDRWSVGDRWQMTKATRQKRVAEKIHKSRT